VFGAAGGGVGTGGVFAVGDIEDVEGAACGWF